MQLLLFNAYAGFVFSCWLMWKAERRHRIANAVHWPLWIKGLIGDIGLVFSRR